MKTNLFTILLAIFLLPLGITTMSSCGKTDDVLCAATWGQDLQDELNAVATTGTAYSQDPSAANCAAYRSALQAYVNALKPYGDCGALTGAQRTAWQQAVDQYEDDLDGLCD